MVAQASRDTGPERALRSELHRRGRRFRIHYRPLAGLRREADLAFPRRKVAVFVDGCFWHRCPIHGSAPKANSLWWQAKLDTTEARDRDTDARLSDAGWTVVRVWEHEPPTLAADRVEAALVTAEAVSN